MNSLLFEANSILSSHRFTYAFCGGWAIDLFLNYESRKHGDIDVLAFWTERDEIILYMQSLGFDVYEMLGGSKARHITDVAIQMKCKRNIFCCKADCDLIHLSKTDEKDICHIDFQSAGQTKLNFIEFLFNDKDDTDLHYARNHSIKRKLKDAILVNDGIPYLAPEICLLYKSTDTERNGYQQDFDLAIRQMDSTQRDWLNQALLYLYPDGHKWIPCVNNNERYNPAI